MAQGMVAFTKIECYDRGRYYFSNGLELGLPHIKLILQQQSEESDFLATLRLVIHKCAGISRTQFHFDIWTSAYGGFSQTGTTALNPNSVYCCV